MTSSERLSLPRSFIRVSWSNLFAQFSEQIALAAAPLAAVLLFSAGPTETGLLQTAQTLPFLLLSIPAGLIVDRAARRTLMIGSEALRAISSALMLPVLALGLVNLPLLAVLGFIGAIGTVCYSVAAPALLPTLVPRTQLGDANRWLELARSIAFAAGPALGGALVGWTGVSTAYAMATVLSLTALMLLTSLPADSVEARPRKRLLHELRDGAEFIARHVLLRPIFITAVFFNMSWFVLQAIYVAYAIQTLGLTAAAVGATIGVYGAGMVAGAWIAPVLSRRLTFGAMALLGPCGGFAGSVVMLLTWWFPSGYLAAVSFFLFGVGPILWVISTTTLRQAVTPNVMLGRVSALVMTATFGARPVGAVIGTLIAARYGVKVCLVAAAIGFFVQLMVIAISRVPKLLVLPESA